MVSFKRYEAAPGLRDHIMGYWHIRAGNQPAVLDLLPDGYPELAFSMQAGSKLRVGRGAAQAFSPGSLIGQMSERTFIFLNSGDEMINIKLYPWTPFYLFQIPACELNNTVTDLEAITAEAAFRQLAFDLRNMNNIVPAVASLDQFFQQKIGSLSPDHPFLHYSVRQIFQTNGVLTIHKLTSSIHASRRYVEKLFKKRLGISPKQYARLIRVKKASLLLLDERFGGNITEVADELGYYDLSHFLKDFKAVADQTPSSFLKRQGNLVFDTTSEYLNQWDYS